MDIEEVITKLQKIREEEGLIEVLVMAVGLAEEVRLTSIEYVDGVVVFEGDED